jgi:DNA-binding transcriptional ArsR family regulator
MNTVMPILYVPERRIVLRLIAELRRDTSGHYLSGAGTQEAQELTSVMGSVYLADLAGKPATASMLSRTTGIPRATILRRLKRLSKAGVVECVERRYRVVRAVVNSPESVSLLKRSVARIKEAAQKLSRLDEDATC